MDEDRLVVELFFEKPTFEEISRIASEMEEAGVKPLMLPPENRDINTHLVVEKSDIEKAKVKLVEMNLPYKTKEVVLIRMENKPGAMADTVKKISDRGVNLTYAFSVTMSQGYSYLLLAAADNEAVLDIAKS
ncbi:hypothetical protein GF318_01340 [Candidatus Micrarchaeota archaeon]|nr:hypothetical protein [Candidatus Micrarchaeota archaeon]